jgi:cytochrome c biogenesis protein CcdA
MLKDNTKRAKGLGYIMIDIIPVLISLALVDCLNPATLTTQTFLLLGTEKPKNRAIAHALGVYVAYFMIGFLIIFGLGESIKQLFTINAGMTEYAILLILGIVLILFGYKMKNVSKGESRIDRYMNKVRTLNPIKTFLFGFVSTFLDVPTAFPYFAAIAILVGAELPFLGVTSLLLLYNFLYVLPMLILVIIYVVAQKKYPQLLQRINQGINKWSGKLARSFLLFIGVLIIIISIAFFFGYSLF